MAARTGCPYHICHISTKETVNLVRRAKQDGLNVTCEVTPHHLLLDDSAITSDNAMLKMKPPLRTLADRQALWAGLMDGTIDIIATDHAPHTTEEKQQALLKAPFGIVGSETAFSLLYTRFVKSGQFTLQQLTEWMSVKPADLFQLNAGRLTVGKVANFTLLPLEVETTIVAKDFASKADNTPFIGQKVFGQPSLTVAGGQIVFKEEV